MLEETLWQGHSDPLRLALRYSAFLLAALVSFTVSWVLLFLFTGLFVGLFLLSYTNLLLRPDRLLVQRYGRCTEWRVSDFGKIQVLQSSLDRFFRTGILWVQVRGKKKPLLLKDLKHPYEGWKRIKIAAFKRQKN